MILLEMGTIRVFLTPRGLFVTHNQLHRSASGNCKRKA